MTYLHMTGWVTQRSECSRRRISVRERRLSLQKHLNTLMRTPMWVFSQGYGRLVTFPLSIILILFVWTSIQYALKTQDQLRNNIKKLSVLRPRLLTTLEAEQLSHQDQGHMFIYQSSQSKSKIERH